MNPVDEWQLATRHIGRRVLVFDVLDSTNSYCASLARDGNLHGLVVLARCQTAGRGQHGRTWICRPGDGVLLSALLFPPAHLRRPVVLTTWAALSVCRLVNEATGLKPRIKWPNDVLVHGKKLCGILIEQKQGVIAGIGLNVNQAQADFDAAGLAEAGSLAIVTGQRQSVDDVARQLVEHLDLLYGEMVDGDPGRLQNEWQQALNLAGKPVRAECHHQNVSGELIEVTFDRLSVRTADGLIHLPPETVKHISEVDSV